ncbi:type I polyketide synthase [Saccharothrix australiensis]|uniref:Acyl transferase domain-containing protein n=1 Tax=Saccharothrix australiensis TaxID=2072 RepID=A0A495W8Z0_9PSEU|nr:type I polyketide synthase [Saccharothrix australiensis]RKT56258.1 acyl transferase domain-containing protein [Saccharothrix australiensis]
MSDEQKLRSYLKRATADLRLMGRRLAEVEEAAREPIAIVGMGCRYPGGVGSPDDLWRLVADGVDAITGFPTDRGWDVRYDPDADRPGTTYVREGGFLTDAAGFDAAFFGISPREALAMDPQQRVLLETAWETFESAGIDPTALQGSRTAVFTGVWSSGYGAQPPPDLEGFLATGIATSATSGRVSYALGLEGPAVSVDTACSSSLVAIHLAARALRAGECALALAGGVTVMATPEGFVEFSRQRGLAPDGRVKPFAEAADGTAWGEGAGLLLLERLSDARRNGHRVLAVVRGSAVNQDGASNGLAAPNGPSQERVIRQALAGARLEPSEVDFVEAHGTGTTLGDPIEAQALLATYGQDRAAPLWLGSVKSNIGHAQAAAGVAGVIKVVQAMRHGVVPRTLHIDAPTLHVDWSAGDILLATEATPWPSTGRPRRAGVSSFGISGTNAHVIIEQAPEEEREEGSPDPVPWPLSARTPEALRAQAARLRAFVDSRPELTSAEVGRALAARAVHEHRAVVGDSAALRALADGVDAPGLVTGTAADVGRTVFVFPGQGAQWVGMGRELYGSEPVFREVVDACAEALAPYVDWSLVEALTGGSLDRVDVVQPALWAMMVGLAELWRSHGVVPDAVVGHSQGEIAAAHVAGLLSLEDAAKVVALRSRALVALAGRGGMVSLALSEDQAHDRLARWAGRLTVAVVNAPGAVVVSGNDQDLGELLAACEADGIRARRLPVDYAAHSAEVEPIRDRLLRPLADIAPRPARIPFHSTVTGAPVDLVDADYWYRNLREPVLFDRVTRALREAGHGAFVEVSPHPVLVSAIEGTVDAVVSGTLRRDGDFATALAGLHVRGVTADWRMPAGPMADGVPTYPFQRRPFWLRPAAAGSGDHPVLTGAVALPDGGAVLSGNVSLGTHGWLADHAVQGVVLLPGTVFLEFVTHAGDHVGAPVVDELVLEAPLVVGDGVAHLQVAVGPDEDGRRSVAVHSRTDDEWVRHATGVLAGEPVWDEWTWPPDADADAVDVTDLYDAFSAAGYEYGPVFQGVTAARRRGDEVYAEVEVPEGDRFALHPAALDAALHAVSLLRGETGAADAARLPFAFREVSVRATRARLLRVRLTAAGPDAYRLAIADGDGRPVARIGSLAVRAADVRPDSLFQLDWVPLPDPVIGDTGDLVAHHVPVTTGDPADAARTCALHVLDLMRAHLGTDGKRLVVVTRGAVVARAGDEVDLAHAAVWGLVRGAVAEHPGRFAVVDADAEGDCALPVVAGSDEAEFAVRGGVARVPRLTRVARPLTPPDGPWRLEDVGTGGIDDLALVARPGLAEPPGPGEVRIALRAAGLNFRDVLIALDVYPGAALLGGEGAGVVLDVGPGVAFRPGDRVMGLVPGAFGPVAVADHRLLAAIPDGWSFARAAAVPVAFLTAWYGLVDLGRTRPGDRVLIHAATGGVGLAAVQLARRLGADVYATAGPAKWDTLRGMGFADDHIASSRTVEFERRFPPMDVVLDSAADEFVDASLRLLAPGGRFVEMGKTDVRDTVERDDITYTAFDIADAGPERLGEILADVLAAFAEGGFTPLPLEVRGVRDAVDVFRHMSQANHIGKIVLGLPADLDGTVLVTGGTGTLGGVLARHLVREHGVRHLLLASRGGGAEALREELTAMGARVTVASCDLANRADVAGLLASVPADRPLCAVVHAAGVLADGVLETLTPDQVERVFAPKVRGAWHLHELTRDLKAFVLFSSAAGLLGSPGQAHYGAANTFLDALAVHRRSLGLPATSLAWGHWAESSGMTGHLAETDHARLRRSGVVPLGTGHALELFDAAMAVDRAVLAPVALDFAAVARAGAVPGALRDLVGARRVARRRTGAVVDRLRSLPPAERLAAAVEVVATHTAIVLGHRDPGAVRAETAFKDLGFDSLTAVELRNRLGVATGLRLPATVTFDHPTPRRLAEHLLAEIGGTRRESAAAAPTAVRDDPVVIVGMGCRLPGGVRSPDDLWRLVADGVDAITGFPTDRGWPVDGLYHPDPDHPGTSYTRAGGFLDDVAGFDAAFFGISPREALAMDPQQRVLLETAWETLEDAGIDPTSLRGSATGVFTGIWSSGYGAGASGDVEGYVGTGAATSVTSGRIAYLLGLEGVAVSLDTACSSSSVAIHLAARALRSGECSLALAGGVTVMATPVGFTEFSRQRGLAADGRCKSFSSSADGTAWAEGAGLVLLERLSDARRNGRRVLAVVRGSAVNQDGASNGLAAPNGPAQERVIRQALADAGLAPSDVDVVEAHGTGTALGDPIEAQALLATYGQDRAAPLWLGSVKSNIGHAQAAAGVAGVIKVVQAMRHGVLPRTLHVAEPTPHVAWDSGNVRLLTEPVPWPSTGRPRRAGVSSFGISGTNAHLVIEQAPAEEPPAGHADGPVAWVLSGRTDAAVRAQARRLGDFVAARPELDPAAVGRVLASGRARFDHRAVVVGRDRRELLAGLGSVEPVAVGRPRRTVFVFPGQGAQWVGMGRELYAESAVFRASVDACAEALAPYVDWSLVEALTGGSLDRVDVVQPALWAMMVGLAELWRSHGVVPDAVVGHSQGEIAAAHVAGLLSLEDAAKVVALRAKALTGIAGRGGMVSVALSEDRAVEYLTRWADRLTVAVLNAPDAVVVSGDDTALDELLAACAADGIRARRLPVDYAAHSPQVEAIRDRLLTDLADVRPATGGVAFHSTVTGGVLGDGLDAAYWYRNLREPVRFADTARELAGDGLFVEISPHPVLVPALAGQDAVALGTLRRDQGGTAGFLAAAGRLFERGVDVRWAFPDLPAVSLPTYPFQRERFWLTPGGVGDVSAAGLDAVDHPLVSAAVELGDGGTVWTGRLSPTTHPWLADHVVEGAVLLPAAVFVELAAHAGDVVEELVLAAPLVLPEDGAVAVQVAVGAPDGTGRRSLEIRSRGDGGWVRHAAGSLGGEPAVTRATTEWPPAGAEQVEGLYDALAAAGYEYGPAFRGVRAAWRRGGEVFAEVEVDDAARFGVHPALLDAALQPLACLADDTGEARLPFSLTGITVHRRGVTRARVRLDTTADGVHRVELTDETGAPVVSIGGLTTRPLARGDDALFRVDWVPLVAGGGPLPSAVVSPGSVAEALALVQDFLAGDGDRLVVRTGGAVAAVPGDRVADPVGAAVWGLVRSAQAEHPGRFVLVDTDGPLPSAVGDEDQVAVRGGAAYVPRLVRTSAEAVGGRLTAAGSGSLADLAFTSCPDEPLAPHEVRVAVRAAGVNFRDVLIALGVYPERAPLGGEGAGVVVEVGAAVTGLRPGDRVLGLLAGAFGPVAVADHRVLVPIPEGWGFPRAAAVPVAFLTAWYALRDLGRLRPGDRVLVHSGAGGVGMAAVRLARLWGAEVFATASPGKWDALRALGLDDDHIASSRTVEFAERFGRVDLVLNSLTGAFVDASLRSLAPGGRFVEMGKADLRDGVPGYRAFDLAEAGPDRLGEILRAVVALLADGDLDGLPVRAWDVRRAREALRHMSQAGHVGKIVLTVPAPLDPRGTVLVTGGTGVLGRLVARHLVVAHGVRRLVLAGRSGVADVAELRELGADVSVVACDVADRDAVARLLAGVPAEHPLTGVVHAAGAVDDGVVESLTPQRLARTWEPKALAAQHLHELTQGLDLRAFVLFSSAAGVFGAPGQANYAAANAYLDGLAAHRRSQGLPAVSLAWGPWAERTGLTAGLSEEDNRRLKRSGLLPLSSAQGLALFDAGQSAADPVVVTARLRASALGDRPVFRSLTSGRAAVRRADSALALADLPETGRLAALARLVAVHTAAVLGHADDAAVPLDRPFQELGFDSLTAVELRNRLSAAVGTRLSATMVFDHPTPERLAEHLRDVVVGARRRVDAPAGVAVADDPVVVVGIGCRYPGGVASADDLWRLVADEVDAIGEFPSDRGWDVDRLYDPAGGPGTSYTRAGGFLDDVAGFDAAFFGISPREALAMDPQQRLVLETAWEALEHAGIDPTSLRGSATGVFTGIFTSGYAGGVEQVARDVEGYLSTGTATSVTSGRVSYLLGLEGPAVSVDTACSSSLVAVHLAAQALRSGECSLALAGGVTVMATPAGFVEFSRQRGLAEDGRAKPFAASADGTSWGEGVGLVVLERLSDARRNGHRVLAVVRGSAVNQDGASNGLTAPNGPSQERVIRQALANAGLRASEVDAVEAHGTGTALGDPIEARALLATYGQDRGEPLWLGSVKSNLGHTQAAAGIAGVIKMIMAMRHGRLPRTLHVDAPTPHVEWSTGNVRLLAEATPWPETGRPRRAGVSAFGISGTNAHLVLEQGPEPVVGPPPGADAGGPVPWALSAASPEALRAQGERLRAVADLDRRAVARALSARTRFAHRAVLIGRDAAGVTGALDALVAGTESPDLVTGVAQPGKTAFVFSGQGSQWVGMGRRLYQVFPVFARALDEVCGLLDLSREVLFTDPDGVLDRTCFTQLSLFALQVALFRLVESLGFRPDYVIGHSVGEVAAAHVAGVLGIEDACALVSARGRLMGELPSGGAMVSVRATEAEVAVSLGDGVCIAAVNGPDAVVVSGDEAAVLEVAALWSARGRETRRLAVSHAFHSARMEPMIAEIERVAAKIGFGEPEIPFVSTVEGRRIDPGAPGYWARQVREVVRFGDGVEWLRANGATRFLEIGPHPVLVPSGVMRRDHDEPERLVAAVARLWVDGADRAPDTGGAGAHDVELPAYPFQRERFWLVPPPPGDGLDAVDHPLLRSVVRLPDDQGLVATGRLAKSAHPWLGEHTVHGSALLPGTGFVELAVQAGAHARCPVVEELVLESPLPLAADTVHVQVTVGAPDDAGRRPLAIHSRTSADPDDWTRHATGALSPEPPVRREARPRPADARPVDITGLYDTLAGAGYDYGPTFRGLTGIWRDGDDLHAEVTFPGVALDGFGIHPALLDAAIQPLTLLTGSTAAPGAAAARLPFSFAGVSVTGTAAAVRVVLTPTGPDTCSVRLTDTAGAPVASIDRLVLRPVEPGPATARPRNALFAVEPAPLAVRDAPPVDVVVHEVTGGDDPVEGTHAATRRLLDVTRAFLSDGGDARLVVVTGGDLPSAAARGFLRSAQTEHPDRIVLVETDGSAASARVLDRAVRTAIADGETHVVLDSGRATAPRLVRSAVDGAPPAIDGTVLITGGTGALGGLVARHVVARHHAPHVVLASRRGPGAPGAAELRAELGAAVTLVACDVTDPTAVRSLVAGIPDLSVVVHAAGVVDDAVVATLTPERLTGVLRPKVDAAWHLHEATGDRDLAAFVLFSSAAATFGAPGQANYAAANAFLDALARHRRAEGLPAVSLAWGYWAEAGGTTGHLTATDHRRLARTGMLPLGTDQALALFDLGLAADRPVLTPIRLDLGAIGTPPALLRGLVRPKAARAEPADLARRLAALPEPEQRALVLEVVNAHSAAVLGHTTRITEDPRQSFRDHGVDSLTAIDLRNRLNAATGLHLSATVVFDFPTPDRLADHLHGRLCGTGNRVAGPMEALLRKAIAADRAQDGVDLLSTAARLGRLGPPVVEPVRLAEGFLRPSLVCLPSALAFSGVEEYGRFAAALAATRDVTVLPLPGFAGDPLPSSAADLVDALAAAAATVDTPVLVGRSIGAWLALATAHHLEDHGKPLAAVVLIDGFPDDLPGVLDGMLAAEHQLRPIDDDRLLATGRYLDLARPPRPVRAPVLLVGTRKRAWPELSTTAQEALTVPGDHFTVLEQHSASTALAISTWLLDFAGYGAGLSELRERDGHDLG